MPSSGLALSLPVTNVTFSAKLVSEVLIFTLISACAETCVQMINIITPTNNTPPAIINLRYFLKFGTLVGKAFLAPRTLFFSSRSSESSSRTPSFSFGLDFFESSSFAVLNGGRTSSSAFSASFSLFFAAVSSSFFSGFFASITSLGSSPISRREKSFGICGLL